MASLVLMMKLRFLYQEIQHKVKKHHNYLHVSNSLDSRFVGSQLPLHTRQVKWI